MKIKYKNLIHEVYGIGSFNNKKLYLIKLETGWPWMEYSFKDLIDLYSGQIINNSLKYGDKVHYVYNTNDLFTIKKYDRKKLLFNENKN